MRRFACPVVAILAALSFSLSAQTLSAPGAAQIGTLVPTEDKGVARAVLIDRPEIRVLRVEIQPGAVRRVHQHDDVKYHLFLPLTPGVELTKDSTNYTSAPAGQAYFMEKGSPHGFRNTGTEVAKVFEVFIRLDPKAAASATPPLFNKDEAIALAMALASLPPGKP
jgi:quercetin dioxygenase-like cupin family protein